MSVFFAKIYLYLKIKFILKEIKGKFIIYWMKNLKFETGFRIEFKI